MAALLNPDDKVAIFWQRLPEASVDTSSTCISLPKGVDWMGTTSICPRTIFMRPCYEVLWRQIQSQLVRIDNDESHDASQSDGSDADFSGDEEGEKEDADFSGEEEEEEDGESRAGDAKRVRMIASSSGCEDSLVEDGGNGDSTSAVAQGSSALASPSRRLYTPSITRWILLGTPGIGKSYFGLYLLWKLRTTNVGDPRSILYRPVNSPDFYWFSSDGVGGVQIAPPGDLALRPLLQNCRTVVIVDAEKPPMGVGVEAVTVLITSPRRSIYWGFSKFGETTFRYMPVFSLEEMLSCHSVSFSAKVRVETVHSLYLRWGGVVRFVLQQASDPTQQALLESALATASMKQVQDSIGLEDAADDVCHRLVHVHVTDPDELMHKCMQMASNYVAERVVDRLVRTERDALLSFLRASAGEAVSGGVRGNLFEVYAHRIIRGGGSFDVRVLGDTTTEATTWVLPACEAHSFGSWKDAQAFRSTHSSAYLQPLVTNLAAVDSVAVLSQSPLASSAASAAPMRHPSVLYCQMTMAAVHPILAAAFQITVQELPTHEKEIPLVFVVPQDRFESFTVQNFLGVKSTKAHPVVVGDPKIKRQHEPAKVSEKRSRKEEHHDIVQYALCIHLTAPPPVFGAGAADSAPVVHDDAPSAGDHAHATGGGAPRRTTDGGLRTGDGAPRDDRCDGAAPGHRSSTAAALTSAASGRDLL